MPNTNKDILSLIIFGLPGAIIRWIFLKTFNKEKTFKDYLADNAYINAAVGIIALVIVILLGYTMT
ncbi:MAG: hypothetical protein DWQ02_27635 [Bacteroidetes bacterium]|nr:MAG: hypothetical protein DWQ02_27635 [Bacteroidota bacterium]